MPKITIEELNKNIKDDIDCPLVHRKINTLICGDTQMVADGEAPVWTAPKELTSVFIFEKICLECPNHWD